MKKIIFVFLIVLSFASCKEKGEITTLPHDFIIIHGKTYKLLSVVPCNDCSSIWIMYPKDSTDSVPQTINYSEQSGKQTINRTIIKVD